MKKYLVTGGAGFIGSHLVDLIADLGHEVIVLDDLSTGKKENLPTINRLIIGDVTHLPTVRRAFSLVDGCFHLAAIASVEKANHDWPRCHDVNTTGTINIFEAARMHKTPVVYASSAAIYGTCHEVLHEEIHRPNPKTAYGAGKYFCEISGRVAAEIHNVPNTGVRLFNVYGPRQDAGSPYSGVVSIFANKIRKRQAITIFGDGSQVRDFIYVKDAAEIMWKCMLKLINKEEIGANVVNACTNQSITLNRLIATMEELVGFRVAHQFCAERPGDIHTSVGSREFAEKWLGHMSQTDLKDGLACLLNSSL